MLYLLFALNPVPKKNNTNGIGHIASEIKPKRPSPHFGVSCGLVMSWRMTSGRNPAAMRRATA